MSVTIATTSPQVDRGPSRFHDVDHLIADATISRQQKIKTLMRWQHEAKLNEMRGRGSRKAQLTLILQALHSLEANDFV